MITASVYMSWRLWATIDHTLHQLTLCFFLFSGLSNGHAGLAHEHEVSTWLPHVYCTVIWYTVPLSCIACRRKATQRLNIVFAFFLCRVSNDSCSLLSININGHTVKVCVFENGKLSIRAASWLLILCIFIIRCVWSQSWRQPLHNSTTQTGGRQTCRISGPPWWSPIWGRRRSWTHRSSPKNKKRVVKR